MSSTWFYFWHTAFILLPLSSLGLLDGSASAIEVNVALHKATYQSSTVNYLTSSFVVDGKKEAGSGCSQTAEERNPWWSVDLQDVYKIKSLKIYFIQKDGKYISSLSVYVHTENAGPMLVCQQNISSFVYEFLSVPCQGKIGQFITVQLENSAAALELCEVEVNGEKPFSGEVEVNGEKPFQADIVSRYYCRSNRVPNEVVGSFSARSRAECAVLCTQRHNCDAFHFKTNAVQKPLCQLKQITSNMLLHNYKEDYNVC